MFWAVCGCGSDGRAIDIKLIRPSTPFENTDPAASPVEEAVNELEFYREIPNH